MDVEGDFLVDSIEGLLVFLDFSSIFGSSRFSEDKLLDMFFFSL